jgi:M3 family oligoendopeptidase
MQISGPKGFNTIKAGFWPLALKDQMRGMTFTPPTDNEKGAAAFGTFPYERPDMDALAGSFERELERFRSAPSFAQCEDAFESLYRLRRSFMSAYNVCHVRHTIDTANTFYEQENAFFDHQLPRFEALKTAFYKALTQSAWRGALTEKWGSQLFRIAELSLRTFSDEVMPSLQEENRLSSEYVKLKAQAQILFEGQTYNLSSIQKEELRPDRARRRAAAEAKWDWFAAHAAELDSLFDELTRLRHGIARTLGFENFTGLGYARMLRTDYDAADVARFRRAIARHVVPLASRLFERQRRRLGLDELHYYDEDLRYPEGNPQPQGDPAWIIGQAGTMYDELSPQTSAFFHNMRQRNLMDLIARDGKATGGYCTFIADQRAPFIFSNFNGSSADIDVLTHEAGHAFQVYRSRHFDVSEYNWPTYEACEIHSMSMEFFTWPWMHLFFGEQTARYRYGHLAGAVTFLPYGVAVDEFQHFVYENPEAGPEARHRAWRALEAKYLPHRNYAGNAYLEGGAFWQKQSHIYGMPFYYIDYTLAQICAFQFWHRSRVDHSAAWADYLRLCEAGGSRSFLGLAEFAGLRSPFGEGCVEESLKPVGDWLEEEAPMVSR